MATRGVYTLRCPLANQTFMDGAPDIESEWHTIQLVLQQGLHPNQFLQSYYNVYGWDGIVRDILYIVASDEDPVDVAENFRGGAYRLHVWPTQEMRIYGLKAAEDAVQANPALELPDEPESTAEPEIQHMELGDTAAGTQE